MQDERTTNSILVSASEIRDFSLPIVKLREKQNSGAIASQARSPNSHSAIPRFRYTQSCP
jgi:hypothetical protein